ncbi:MAG: indolepyruvate oxidoreductase subunit beta [bacterium]
MKKMFNILMVGVGGQGIILSSDILTRAALNSGYDVKKSEIHGMSQRGGSVSSHIRFGEKIYSPVISRSEADFLISLEEMEILRWQKYLNYKTRILFLKNRILPFTATKYPEGIEEEVTKRYKNTIVVDPEKLKEEIGHSKFINIAIVGLLSNFLSIDEASWKESIKELVPQGTVDKNLNAFNVGKTLL